MKRSFFHIAKPWLLLFGGILGFVLLAQLVRFRIDLTEEKRYSLHRGTEKVLTQITEPMHVDILLVGENLPGGMRRLQKSIEETVRTFNAYSPEPITFSYFDPLNVDQGEQEQFILSLADYGIIATNLFVTQNSGQQAQLIFPGFLVSDSEFETGALVLKGERGMSSEQILNQSIENLEFELSKAIQKLISPTSSTIAMLIGHGENAQDDGFGIVEALDGEFEIFKVPMDQAKKTADLATFKTIFIQSPKEQFAEREIYLLDQYVLGGGNLVVLLNGVAVEEAALYDGATVAMPFETGLENLLFRYGVRVNNDLIQDFNFGLIPTMAGNFGNQEQMQPMPWLYYFQAQLMQNHPITKGLDVVNFRFASSIDTVKADGVDKTPLLFTSDYSRILEAPIQISLGEVKIEPDPKDFGIKNLSLGYLLEGEFTSAFKNRFVPVEFNAADFKESGQGKVVVFGDGELFQSQISFRDGSPLRLGEDQLSQTTFANKAFLSNLVNYLADPEGIIASRTRTIKIRPLNKVKVASEKTFWQLTNVVLPVILLLGIGSGVWMIRRKRYGSKI
jgi:gliding-associated putative ABC transporter substrate-binding component GldG